MRIALAGLATSHPYTDARTLRDHARLTVWEPDPVRLQRFREQHPDAVVLPDLGALLDAQPDGVVLTVPTPQVPEALARVLSCDLPCFVNKPAAATRNGLAALEAVVTRAPHRVLSSSVLRFAPPFTRFAVPRDQVLQLRATVRHDVGLWAAGHNPWQDDPRLGGGTLVTMGLHGLELLVSLLGPAVRLAGAAAVTRHYRTLRSEDVAVLALQWDDGVPGTVEVLGVAGHESYEVTVQTTAGERHLVLAGGPDTESTLGYRAAVEAFLQMVRGAPSPVPWEQTRAVLSTLVAAREVVAVHRAHPAV